jgi:hypothetical protein
MKISGVFYTHPIKYIINNNNIVSICIDSLVTTPANDKLMRTRALVAVFFFGAAKWLGGKMYK